MNRTDDIARYAEGLMEADEQAAFETRLAADASLQQQLALYREVHATLQQHFTPDEQLAQLQQTLNSMRGQFFTATKAPARVVPFKRYLQRAMAVAAILIAVVFIWQPWKPGLFKQYAETTMVAPVERGGDADSVLQQAVTAFNHKEFATAAPLLEKLYQQDSANSFIAFYYGVALLQINRLTDARTVMGHIFAGPSAFKYEGAFYLGLSYLKEKDKANCINWLQKIPPDAPNYDKARELLKKLQ